MAPFFYHLWKRYTLNKHFLITVRFCGVFSWVTHFRWQIRLHLFLSAASTNQDQDQDQDWAVTRGWKPWQRIRSMSSCCPAAALTQSHVDTSICSVRCVCVCVCARARALLIEFFKDQSYRYVPIPCQISETTCRKARYVPSANDAARGTVALETRPVPQQRPHPLMCPTGQKQRWSTTLKAILATMLTRMILM